MTRDAIDNALRAITTEIKESVSSYFAPVRAVAIEISRSVNEATAHKTEHERDSGRP